MTIKSQSQLDKELTQPDEWPTSEDELTDDDESCEDELTAIIEQLAARIDALEDALSDVVSHRRDSVFFQPTTPTYASERKRTDQ